MAARFDRLLFDRLRRLGGGSPREIPGGIVDELRRLLTRSQPHSWRCENRDTIFLKVVGGKHRRLTLNDIHDTFITIRQYLMQDAPARGTFCRIHTLGIRSRSTCKPFLIFHWGDEGATEPRSSEDRARTNQHPAELTCYTNRFNERPICHLTVVEGSCQHCIFRIPPAE